MLHPGQVIDRYEVEAVLGEGGMAVVYRVRHTTLGSLHALKVLTTGGKNVRQRLLAEGRAQAGLDHPNAVVVTDVIDVDGAPGLVMEFIEGGTLDEWVERDDPSREARLAAFSDILAAVAEAHRRGWIHRDLKPGNVLIKQTGGRLVPKVADFGLVKAVLGDSPLKKGRTRDGIAMGTPGFMAPEQIADAANVDARADVFSLACVLIWLLTGEGPFKGETPLEIFGNVATASHASLPPTDALSSFVDRCLSNDPDHRPSDAGKMLDEFRKAQEPTPDSRRETRSLVEPRRRGRGMFRYVVLGLLGAFTAATLAVCLFGLTFGMTGRKRLRTCPTGGSGRIGFVRIDANTSPTEGARVTLNRRAAVIMDPRIDPRKAVCALPAGTTVTVKGTGARGWLPVHREKVRKPSP